MHPSTLASTGLYSDWPSRTVDPALLAYAPGLTIWSDGAEKRRWLALPLGTRITTSDMDRWSFPGGTKVWQEFRVMNPSAGAYELAETRFLCKQRNGTWFETTYAWSLDGSAANELTTGETRWNGTTYEILEQRRCVECHNGASDGVLGFEAVSLAASGTSPTLAELEARNIFTANPDPNALAIPGGPVDIAALGWLHANCGTSCHNQTGVAPLAGSTGLWTRLTIATMQSVQSTDAYSTSAGVPSSYQPASATYRYSRIAPGDSARSVVAIRTASRVTGVQMPPIDTHVVSAGGVPALDAWIDAMPLPVAANPTPDDGGAAGAAADALPGSGAAADASPGDGGAADGSPGDGDAADASPGDGGTADAWQGVAAADGGGGGQAAAINPDPSVFQRHKNATRDGNYVDPLMTRASVRGLHADPAFNPPLMNGPIYAQPLYVENGSMGRETVYVATEQDSVFALDARTGTLFWQKQVGTPVPMSAFACANIDSEGITGTPVIDPATRTIFLDAVNSNDGGRTKQHLVYGLSLDDGTVRAGYPVDVSTALAPIVPFDPALEQQRGALALFQNTVYVPFGGYSQDCGNYHGFVVGIPIGQPTNVVQWHVPALLGGIWGVGGPSTDGTSLYVATGNTYTTMSLWQGGNAVIRLGPMLSFSGMPSDFFMPSNWQYLDEADLDLGGSQPIVLDMPGAVHPKLLIALGKSGNIHVIDRTNLGGIGKGDGANGEGLASAHVATNYIVNAGAAYTTTSGTYVVFKGAGVQCPSGSTLLAVKIGAGDPPAITHAWCAAPDSNGSPIVSTTDGHAEPIIWTVGADGNGKLNALDGETGETLFDGGPNGGFPPIARYQSAIIAKGRAIWASNTRLFAFTLK
jgi:hypothetical protein